MDNNVLIAEFSTEWILDYRQLTDAFALWNLGNPPSSVDIVVDESEREYRPLLRSLEGKTWQELLMTMDDSIEAFYLKEKAWLYYLPAFLLFPRPDVGAIGYDMDILRMPPSDDEALEPIKLETLIDNLSTVQTYALRHHIGLHAVSTKHTLWPGYAKRIWDDCWNDMD